MQKESLREASTPREKAKENKHLQLRVRPLTIRPNEKEKGRLEDVFNVVARIIKQNVRSVRAKEKAKVKEQEEERTG